MGDFNEIFLGNQKNFRGCIENVVFNGLDVMMKAEDQAATIGDAKVGAGIIRIINLKVPLCEIFDHSDFHDFYTIKPFWVGDFGAKI